LSRSRQWELEDRPARQQCQHFVVPGEKWRRRWFRALHLRQFERNHFGLGHGDDGLYPGHDPRGNLYRVAINGAQTQLYAANGAGTGSVDVFDSTFAPLSLGPDAFVNPALPAGLVPFNVRDIGGNIYVTYAPAGRPAQISAPLGAGAVAIFDEDGNFITQLITGGRLAARWGMTLAPAGFGRFINHLLVGNFSFLNSAINAFDPTTGKFRGTIRIDVGKGHTPGGLWTLDFGAGGSNGDPNTLYFSDGINGETAGLFGAIFANGNGS
jgi:uncharacterized protein (TIGR03118 family)